MPSNSESAVNLPQGLTLLNMPKDANYLYNAVAIHLETDATSLKELVTTSLINNFDKYLEFMVLPSGKTPKDYSNIRDAANNANLNAVISELLALNEDLEINILSELLLPRQIIIIGPDGDIRNKWQLNKQLNEKAPPIFIYYNDLNYYDGLIVSTDYTATEILDNLLQQEEQNKIKQQASSVNLNIFTGMLRSSFVMLQSGLNKILDYTFSTKSQQSGNTATHLLPNIANSSDCDLDYSVGSQRNNQLPRSELSFCPQPSAVTSTANLPAVASPQQVNLNSLKSKVFEHHISPDDGNCFYTSVAKHLMLETNKDLKNPMYAQEVIVTCSAWRADLAKYLREHLYDQEIKEMLEVQAIAYEITKLEEEKLEKSQLLANSSTLSLTPEQSNIIATQISEINYRIENFIINDDIIDTYINGIAGNAYADNLEISLIAKELKRDIIIVHTDTVPVSTSLVPQSSQHSAMGKHNPPIYLQKTGKHYNLFILKEAYKNTPPHQILQDIANIAQPPASSGDPYVAASPLIHSNRLVGDRANIVSKKADDYIINILYSTNQDVLESLFDHEECATDGSCFYHAVTKHMLGDLDPEYAQSLRIGVYNDIYTQYQESLKKTQQELSGASQEGLPLKEVLAMQTREALRKSDNANVTDLEITNYIANINNRGYANELEIISLAKSLNLNFIIFQRDQNNNIDYSIIENPANQGNSVVATNTIFLEKKGAHYNLYELKPAISKKIFSNNTAGISLQQFGEIIKYYSIVISNEIACKKLRSR